MNDPDGAWTPHLSRVICHWEAKLDQFIVIMEKDTESDQDLEKLRELGLNTWSDAKELRCQLDSFILAPPYGFTADAAVVLKEWPINARRAYQVVTETPFGDLPMTFIQFCEQLLR